MTSQSAHRSVRRWRARLVVAGAVAAVTGAFAAPQALAGQATQAPVGATHAQAGKAACEQFFVSPRGNDSGPGTISQPWRTITHARDYIRDHGLNSPQQMHCDIAVNLLPGSYRAASTIDFTSADSGANGYQVIYRSYAGPGKAQLLGSRRITGWQPYQGGIDRAYVGTSANFSTLYVDGQRATDARTPTRTATTSWAPYLTSTGVNGSYTQLTYAPGDVNPTWDLKGAQVVIWSGGSWSWFTDTVPIASVDTSADMITLAQETRYPIYQYGHGSRYFIQNSLSLLTQPGEYYLDQSAGWLYYWPKGGNIASQDIEAPTVQTILSVAGDSQADRAHDIEFEGLGLKYTDFVGSWYRFGWVTAGGSGQPEEYPAYDRQIELPQNRFGAITLTDTTDIKLTGLNISETGWHAIYLLFANDHDTVSRSAIGDTGGDGIRVDGPYPGTGNVSNYNTFTDNYIHNVGEVEEGNAAGVILMDSSDNTVSHSVIENSPRYAVAWEAVGGVATADNYAYGNKLSYLRIAHMGQDSGDTGAIYAYETDNLPNSVYQVTVTDVNADPSMPDVPPSGINMDVGTCGQTFTDVQVTDAEDVPFNAGSLSCYTFNNVNWTGTFDPAQIQYSRIGVEPGFPYPVPPS
jgi:parallel beta helix pectate lyase-like protein/glycosyl hydrolase family 141